MVFVIQVKVFIRNLNILNMYIIVVIPYLKI